MGVTEFPRNASGVSGKIVFATPHHQTLAKVHLFSALVAHALRLLLVPTLEYGQPGVDLASSRDGHSQGILPPIKRVSAAAAATAAAAAATTAAASLGPSHGGKHGESSYPDASNTETRSPASRRSHARSAHVKLQACTTIRLSPLMSMHDSSNDGTGGFSEDGNRTTGGSDGSGDCNGGGGGGSGTLSGGLLVASVSECDSSAFGDDFDGGDTSGGLLQPDEESEDSDDGDDISSEKLAHRQSNSYEDRFRCRSSISQQFMALADTVASDVARGDSPAHSNLIQRMTLVSFCPNFVCHKLEFLSKL